jgi:hypothetical protein
MKKFSEKELNEKLLKKISKNWIFPIPLMKMLRIERPTMRSGRKDTVYIFKCITVECTNEIRVWDLKKRTETRCISCIHKKEPYRHIYNKLLTAFKKNINPRNTLTFEQFLTFVNKNCVYCESEISWLKFFSRSTGKRISHGYNLDRKNPNEGYFLSNCVPCCSTCNWTKSDIFTFEEFLIIGKAIGKVLRNRK